MFNYINNIYHPYSLQNCFSPCCPSPPSEPPPLIGPLHRPFSSTLPQSCTYPWYPPPHTGSLEPPTPPCSNMYGDWLYPPFISSPSQASLPPLSPCSDCPSNMRSSPILSPSPYSPTPYRNTLPIASPSSMGTLDSIYPNSHTGHHRHHEEKSDKQTPEPSATALNLSEYRPPRDFSGPIYFHHHLLPPSRTCYQAPVAPMVQESFSLNVSSLIQNVNTSPHGTPSLPNDASFGNVVTNRESRRASSPRPNFSSTTPKRYHRLLSRTEQAIQASMSEEEDDEECESKLRISESPGLDVSNKVTSACQVNMQFKLNYDEDSKVFLTCKSDSSEFTSPEPPQRDTSEESSAIPVATSLTPACKSTIINEVIDTSEAHFQIDSDAEKIPTLPVESAELIDFVNNRGLDKLVDSIESVISLNNECSKTVSVSDMIETPSVPKVSDHNPSDRNQSSYDGLKLLSALAEQRRLEEEENKMDSLRRHSIDCQESLKDTPNHEKTGLQEESKTLSNKVVKRKHRSESCFSAINMGVSEICESSSTKFSSLTSNAEDSSKTDNHPKRKRKSSSSSVIDPWQIRRSVRIFIHESYAQSGIHPPDARRELFEKTPSKKTKSRHDSNSGNESETTENEKLLLFKSDEPPDFNVKLESDERVLVHLDNLLYAGTINPMKEPDKMYTITLDGVKSQNRHYYSEVDLLKLTIKEIKPCSADQLPPGSRVCAFWAGQHKCLYAGKVVNNPSPYPLEGDFVFVEFDDGDKGRISIKDVRLLPDDFPLQKGEGFVSKKSKRLRDREAEKNKPAIKESATISHDAVRIRKKRHQKTNEEVKRDMQKNLPSKEQINSQKIENNEVVNTEGKTTDEILCDAKNQDLLNQEKRVFSPSHNISRSDEPSVEQKVWLWNDTPFKKVGVKGKYRKLYHREIKRDDEVIKTGDCAVFVSTGRPNLPFVGRIDSMWESASGNMVVRVKWFYHPEETKNQPNLVDVQGALFESKHYDENHIQTISHKCSVLPWPKYQEKISKRPESEVNDTRLYYYAGDYDPLPGKINLSVGVPLREN